ncbi:MAG: hypothetical protein AAB801_00045 [Patescibacteria group bacterium]
MQQTKKQKKRSKRKKFGLFLFFLGYFILLLSGLLYIVQHKFFPDDVLISPISTESKKSLSQILDSKKIRYESIEKIDDYYLVKTNDGGEVLISDRKSIDEQVSSLQLISDRLKIEGKKFKRLDFRFDRPVIKF